MADVVLPESSFALHNTAIDITARLIADVPTTWDTTEGTFVFDILAAVANEIEGIYLLLDQAFDQGFAQTATDVYLDAIGEMLGLSRKTGNLASVTLTFTGSPDGTVVPVGTRVSNVVPAGDTATPSIFETVEVGVIASGTANVAAIATEIGTVNNVVAGALTSIDVATAGIISVTNAAPATGGVDEEDDDPFRVRLLNRAAQGRGAGTAGDYVSWAASVEGVGFAYCEPLYAGPGTVRVTVMDLTYGPVSSAVLASATDYVLGLAPIGASVVVVTPSTVSIDISVHLVLDTGYTTGSVTTSIQSAVTDYLKTVQPSGIVYVTAIGAAIKSVAGVLDYLSLQIGDPGLGTSNLTLGASQKPIAGTLTFV